MDHLWGFGWPAWELETQFILWEGILQQKNDRCIFSPACGLLESARKLEVQVILRMWRQLNSVHLFLDPAS